LVIIFRGFASQTEFSYIIQLFGNKQKLQTFGAAVMLKNQTADKR
jgi:hypothetical protein